MDNYRFDKEPRHIVQMIMMVTLTVFSLVLVMLNRLLDWEIWMLPVLMAGMILCWVMQILHVSTLRLRVYVTAAVLMLEAYYYAVNSNTIYDSGAVLVIMIVLFVLTAEKPIWIAGILVEYAGMVCHLLTAKQEGRLILDLSNVVRVVLQFLYIFLAAVLVTRIISVVKQREQDCGDRLQKAIAETKSFNHLLLRIAGQIRSELDRLREISGISEPRLTNGERTVGRVPGCTQAELHSLQCLFEQGRQRLVAKMEDIQDFAVIDAKQVTVRHASYRITSIVESILSQVGFWNDTGLDIVFDLDGTIPERLKGDGDKIRKIIRHLVANSCRFTQDGGVYVHICQVKRPYGINLMIEVEDTGCGMSEEDLERVYDKFFRAGAKETEQTGGLGLGLSVVNGFVQAMGGVMSIESVRGEGTKVIVSVPQEVHSKQHCLILKDADQLALAGFLGFATTKIPKVWDYYMRMITNLMASWSIAFPRVTSLQDLKELQKTMQITHLFVGTGEYLNNKNYIDRLAASMKVALVRDMNFEGEIDEHITVIDKPFYGDQIADFLNAAGTTAAQDVAASPAENPADPAVSPAESRSDTLAGDSVADPADNLFAKGQKGSGAALPGKMKNESTSNNALKDSPLQHGETPAGSVQIGGRLDIDGLDYDQGLSYCMDEEEFYREVLWEYASGHEEKVTELEKAFSDQDWKLYTIKVHAIKSTSKIIGAEELSAQAREMEIAASGQDEQLLIERHPDFLAAYAGLVRSIEEALRRERSGSEAQEGSEPAEPWVRAASEFGENRPQDELQSAASRAQAVSEFGENRPRDESQSAASGTQEGNGSEMKGSWVQTEPGVFELSSGGGDEA